MIKNGTSIAQRHQANYTANLDISDFSDNVTVRVHHNGRKVASTTDDED
jgi:hypothetical protein